MTGGVLSNASIVARIVNATPEDRVVAFDGSGNLVKRSNRIQDALVGLSGPPGCRHLTFVGRSGGLDVELATEAEVADLMLQYRRAVRRFEATKEEATS